MSSKALKITIAANELIGELVAALGGIPDKNCSCHASPPCSDCVNYGHIRNLIADYEASKKFTEIEVEKLPITVSLDGDKWCAHRSDFTNLQESLAAFDSTPTLAVDSLLRLEGGAK